MSDQTPPGWYPHSTMANTRAYWDGERWTDHIAPADQASVRGDATQAASKVFLLIVAAAAVVLMAMVADAIVRGLD